MLWGQREYEQQLPQVPDATVRWSRGGTVWTRDEVASLLDRLNALWDARFGIMGNVPLRNADGHPVLCAS